MRMTPWLMGAMLLGTTLVLPPSLPTHCTTREDRLLGRLETTCADGTTAISRYDPLLDRWETTITTPPRAPLQGPPWKREHRGPGSGLTH